jgi:hypothetical protein
VHEQAGSIATTAGAYLDQYLTGLDSMALVLVRQPCHALDRGVRRCSRIRARNRCS